MVEEITGRLLDEPMITVVDADVNVYADVDDDVVLA
jgi:hypothetical protein